MLTREELTAAISLDRVGRSDTQLDVEKLQWVAAQHLAKESLEELTEHVRPFVDAERWPWAMVNLPGVVETLRTRMSTYGDIGEHLGLIFPDDAVVGPRRVALGTNSDTGKVLRSVRDALAAAQEWTPEALDKTIRAAGAVVEAKGAALFHPVREVLIGSEKGPDIGKILVAIGREEALRRFGQAVG